MTIVQVLDGNTVIFVSLALAQVLRNTAPFFQAASLRFSVSTGRERLVAIRDLILLAALPAFMCQLIAQSLCRLVFGQG